MVHPEHVWSLISKYIEKERHRILSMDVGTFLAEKAEYFQKNNIRRIYYMPIEEFAKMEKFSVRLARVLTNTYRHAGKGESSYDKGRCRYIGDVVQLEEEDLMYRRRGFGKLCLEELTNLLSKYNLALGMKLPKQVNKKLDRIHKAEGERLEAVRRTFAGSGYRKE